MYRRITAGGAFHLSPDRETVLFLSACAGLCLGCFTALSFPRDVLHDCGKAVMAADENIISHCMSGLLPLLLAAAFCFGGAQGLALSVPMGLALGLAAFCLCAMVCAFGIPGAVPGTMLMLDRAAGIYFLSWFLQDGKQTPARLGIAAFGTASASLLFSAFLSPALARLYETVFISL